MAQIFVEKLLAATEDEATLERIWAALEGIALDLNGMVAGYDVLLVRPDQEEAEEQGPYLEFKPIKTKVGG